MRRMKRWSMIAMAGLGSIVFQSCPLGNIGSFLTDCFDNNTISEREYDDMNSFEQLLYEGNDCGRYEQRIG